MSAPSSSPVEVFSVRGDGVTRVTAAASSEAALLVDAMNENFSGVVIKAQAGSSGTDFFLIQV